MSTIALITLIAGLSIFLFFWLIDGFDFDETIEERWYAVVAGIAGVLGGLYFIVKWIIQGIVWLAKIVWTILSSPTTWIIVGSIVLVFVIIKLIIYLRKRYLNKIFTEAENRIREDLELPISHGAVNKSNYKYCTQTTQKLLDLKERLKPEGTPNLQLKRQFFNEKLLLFYNVSMAYEALSDKVYSDFKKVSDCSVKTGDYSLLRKDSKEKTIIESSIPLYSGELTTIKKKLDENQMEEIAENWNIAKDYDTTNWLRLWTSVSKMKEKTRLMKEFYDAARFEFKELEGISEKTNYILGYSRLCAFRNIYLGVELINYTRDNSGGKRLKAQSDLINSKTELADINFSNGDISTNISIIDNISSFADSANSFISDKDNFDFALNNPKTAAGVAAAGLALQFIGDWLEKRSQAIENNNKIQKEIIESFEKLSDAYLVCQSQMYRAIEIITAIVNANKGFLSVYVPLRDRVFSEKGSLSNIDIQNLVLASKKFKKISDSTLN